MMLKRGQEEIVGFVAIVVIVALVGVVFIGFSLSNKQKQGVTTSIEVRQFLEGAMDYTGDCSIGSEGQNRGIGMNIVSCGSDLGASCTSGEMVCSSVNKTIIALLNASFPVQNGSAIKGYQFEASYEGIVNSTILSIKNGDCGGSYQADYIPYNTYNPNSKIRVSLKLCS